MKIFFRTIICLFCLSLVACSTFSAPEMKQLTVQVPFIAINAEKLAEWKAGQTPKQYFYDFPQKYAKLVEVLKDPGNYDMLTEDQAFEVAEKTFSARGVKLERNQYVINEAGLHLVLDAYDPALKIGFEFLTKEANDLEPDDNGAGPGLNDLEAYYLSQLPNETGIRIIVITGYGPYYKFSSTEKKEFADNQMRTFVAKDITSFMAGLPEKLLKPKK